VELENQKSPEAPHTPNGGKAVPSADANPPQIVVSPDLETQLYIKLPDGSEATVVTVSNAPVTPSLVGQKVYLPSHKSHPTQATPAPVSTPPALVANMSPPRL